MKKCVFSGTFDPPTKGHEYVIENCLKMFDEVVVAVMVNPDKEPLIPAEKRKELIEKLFAGEKRVRVCTFDGAATDLLQRENTPFYVRGVRDVIDFEYENRNFFANRNLMGDIVTIYLPAPQENIVISSSLVRNSIKFKKAYSDYIPAPILQDVIKLLQNPQ